MAKRSFISSMSFLVTMGSFVACGANAETDAPVPSASENEVCDAVEQTGSALAHGGVGSACGNGFPACDPGLFCIGSPGFSGTCQPPGVEGSGCGGGIFPPCVPGLFCIGAPGFSGTCRSPAGFGQPCGGISFPPCVPGLFCATAIPGGIGTCQ